MARVIYFFDPTQGNIESFEKIQAEINNQAGYFFRNHLVKIGETNILTNHKSLIPPYERQKAIVQKAYSCTGFEFDEVIHEVMMTFEGVRYFGGEYAQQDAEDFKNGINL